ncbi:MAG TPA: hypothetical protein VFI74_01880 [Candidatus Saccharimonadales bacterium]|nr:hypothetical protein [Candidatus Saccharimonadales bacterium]
MSTPEISQPDFIHLAANERAAQDGSSSFALVTRSYGNAILGFHRGGSDSLGLSMTLESSRGIQHHSGIYFDGGSTYIYPFKEVASVDALIAKHRSPKLALAPDKERSFNEASPRRIGIHEAASMLMERAVDDPARVVFYTGAGISLGGKAPVYDHSHLLGSLGISEKSTLRSSADNEQFCRTFLQDAAYTKRVYDAFVETNETFFRDVSSPAHCALASLVRRMKRAPAILTTNHDLKHEAEGSRLAAIHVPPYWHDAQACRRPDLATNVRTYVAENAGAIDLAVVVGVSRDYRRLFEALHANNPSFRILGIDTNVEPPRYLSNSDYYLQGDAQHVLPAIAGHNALKEGA